MPHVLILLHTATEEPGSITGFLDQQRARVTVVKLFDGVPLPADPCVFNCIIAMGGTMNVYESDAFPFLRDEPAFLHAAMRAHVPVLGVCLGAQLIARACGAPVVKSPQPEVGWYPITLTPAAAQEPAFAGIPAELTVLQWHEDMAMLPESAVLLASSPACPHQAFRVGSALALQFHVEMTQELLAQWTHDKPHLRHIATEFSHFGVRLQPHATRIYEHFWHAVTAHAAQAASVSRAE